MIAPTSEPGVNPVPMLFLCIGSELVDGGEGEDHKSRCAYPLHHLDRYIGAEHGQEKVVGKFIRSIEQIVFPAYRAKRASPALSTSNRPDSKVIQVAPQCLISIPP